MNYEETEVLKETVETDTEMKNWLVNYVGEMHDQKIIEEEGLLEPKTGN